MRKSPTFESMMVAKQILEQIFWGVVNQSGHQRS